MRIRLFYTDGSEIRAKGWKAKALIRRELQGTGFGLNDVIALKPGEWMHLVRGATLDCKAWSGHGNGKLVSCYDEGLRNNYLRDRFSVLVK